MTETTEAPPKEEAKPSAPKGKKFGWKRAFGWMVGMVVGGVLGIGLLSLSIGYARADAVDAKGKPSDIVSFAPYGEGYRTYSWLGNGLLGRQYARRDVRRVLLNAFQAKDHKAGRNHVLADVGNSNGNPKKALSGHISHKNGLAVDVHLPLKRGKVAAEMPTSIWNLWGYLWRFDETGKLAGRTFNRRSGSLGCKQRNQPWNWEGAGDPSYEVDFEELALFLKAVRDESRKSPSLRLKKVILWPPFQRRLKKVAPGLFKGKGRVPFSKDCVWVIHDEHVHLHFKPVK